MRGFLGYRFLCLRVEIFCRFIEIKGFYFYLELEKVREFRIFFSFFWKVV